MPRKKKLPPNVRRRATAKGDRFRAVVTIAGKRRVSPLCETPEEAAAWLARFRELREKPTSRPLHVTLADGLELIRSDLEQTGGRAATLDFYENHARILFDRLGGSATAVHRITQQDVRDYMLRRQREGVAASTAWGKELFVLRRIIKLAREAGYMIPSDPFEGIRPPKTRQGRFGVLSPEKVAEILSTMRAHARGKGAWHADLAELIYRTGLRRAEVSRLLVEDIEFDNKRIFVDGKTGHRYVPMGSDLASVCRRLIESAQPNGHIISSHRVIEQAFGRWRERLDEADFSPHALRHSYATAMASEVEPFELMTLLGHSTLTQTARYYHARGDGVRAAQDGLLPDQPVRPRPRRELRKPRR